MKNEKLLRLLIFILSVVVFILAISLSTLALSFGVSLVVATICWISYWIIFFLTAYQAVPTKEIWITEIFGKFHRQLQPGFNILIPGIEKIRSEVYMGQQMMELYMDNKFHGGYGDGDVEFKDCSGVGVKAFFYFKINDAKKATYEITEIFDAIAEKADSVLRINFMMYTLDQAMSLQGRLNLENIACYVDLSTEANKIAPDELHDSYLKSEFKVAFDEIGIEPKCFVISDFNLPASIKDQRDQTLKAEKEKEVAQIALEVSRIEKKTSIVKAEALKQAKVLEGEGEASKISAVLKVADLPQDQVAKYLTEGLKWEAVSKSKATDKVILISEGDGTSANGAKFGAGSGAVQK